MKSVLLFAAAVSALTFAVETADAQTRTRARARAAVAVQAPLPPTPYQLIGPGSEAAQTPAQAAPATAEEPEAAPAQRAAPATRATPATPATPAEGAAATPATPATPASPAAPPTESTEEEEADEADAGAATPERTRAEAALRRVLVGLAAGTPDYGMMNEETAARVRTQQPSLTPALKQYGAVQTITALAPAGGSQRFRVQFANGAATFVINADAEGKITALGVES